LVERDAGRIDISIPGTNDRRDLLQDAQFWPGDMGHGRKAHAGFVAHWSTLRPSLSSAMLFTNQSPQTTLQGHSLGAACAVLAVASMPSWFRGATVHLFGCPQVGNGNFATIFERNCQDLDITVWRVVNRGDPVATLDLPGDWQHVGKLVEIGLAGDFKPDHGISEYIAALRAML
jgi:predicted lipase